MYSLTDSRTHALTNPTSRAPGFASTAGAKNKLGLNYVKLITNVEYICFFKKVGLHWLSMFSLVWYVWLISLIDLIW